MDTNNILAMITTDELVDYDDRTEVETTEKRKVFPVNVPISVILAWVEKEGADSVTLLRLECPLS